MRNAHCRTWNKTRKQKIMENEKHTFQEVKYGRNIEKREKRKTHTGGPEIGRDN